MTRSQWGVVLAIAVPLGLAALSRASSSSVDRALLAPKIAGHSVTLPQAFDAAGNVNSKARATIVWVLRGADCGWCNATEVGYWRRLATECPEVAVRLVAVGPDTQRVGAFARRYRFPGSLSATVSMDSLGLSGWPTPLWLLVDSTSRVLLSSGIRSPSSPYPLQILEIGRALGGCSIAPDVSEERR